MENKYVIVSLSDERAKSISEVLGNKTCKKIIDFLSETKEASESDISAKLKMPLNTAEYNIKKLLESGLIEKARNYFWSSKGKKIDLYKLSNKSIVISPKARVTSKLKSLVPVALITGVFAVFLRFFYFSNQANDFAQKEGGQVLTATAEKAAGVSGIINPGIALWFFIGAISASILYLILNWRKL